MIGHWLNGETGKTVEWSKHQQPSEDFMNKKNQYGVDNNAENQGGQLFVMLIWMSRALLYRKRGKGGKSGGKEPTLKVNLEQNCFPKAKANPDIRSITAEHFTELC